MSRACSHVSSRSDGAGLIDSTVLPWYNFSGGSKSSNFREVDTMGKNEFREAFGRIVFDRPALLKNLILFPIVQRAGHSSQHRIISLHSAMRDGIIEVRETGRIEEIEVVNKGPDKVLGIDGQEVRGGRQNRVLNFSALIGEDAGSLISTLCVEEGRWAGAALNFSEGRIAHPTLRSLIARTTYLDGANLQRNVWSSLNRSFGTMRAYSATRSMADLYTSVDNDIQSLAGHMKPEEDQAGVLVVVGGRYVCIDVFESPSLFRDFLPILAESYAMDALLHIGRRGSWDFLDRLPHILREKLDGALETRSASPSRRDDILLNSETFQGSALIHGGEPVHLSTFMEIA
jgi:hypothetical protein